MLHKTCSSCLIEQEIINFNNSNKSKDGLNNACKKCINEYFKNYREKNREQVNKNSLKYANTDIGKEKHRIYESKRRANKISSSDGTVTYSSTQQRLIEQDYKCRHCNIDLNKEGIIKHLDHIHPLSTGGIHSIDNIQWLCSTCNLSKNNYFIG